MEKRTFVTKVRRGVTGGSREYILGKISGIGYVVCGEAKKPIQLNPDGSAMFTVECAANDYSRFRTIVNDLYPNLCIFDYYGGL